MKFRLSQAVCSKLPGIQVGIIVIKNVENLKKVSTPDQLLAGSCAQRKSEWANDALYKEATALIEKTKIDDQILPEAQLLESNIRKIKRGKPPIGKNNLHAIFSYLSIKYMVALQGQDLDQLDSDIVIDFITPKKGKKTPDIDVERETTNIALWFIDVGSQPKEEFLRLPHEFATHIQKYCGGTEPEIHILNCDNKEVDLGYESEKERERKAQEPELQAEPQQEEQTSASPSQSTPIPAVKTQQETPVTQPAKQEGSTQEQLKKALKAALQKLQLPSEEIIEIETPADLSHGDFSSNIALKLSKTVEKAPQELAKSVIEALPTLDFVNKTDIAGPGFINFHLSQQHFEQELDKILAQKEQFGELSIGNGQKVLVEYSSPNIAKPLGVHHLLSTILGQAIADLHRKAGYETVSLNYPGDWGTQYGKLLYAYKQWGDEQTVKADPLNELLKLYVKFHEEAEEDPSLEDKGREEFKKLEEGNEENLKLWQWMRDVSIEAIENIYQRLGVSFDEYLGEAMYGEASQKILEEGKRKGVFVEGEKGAYIVKFEDENMPPYMVQKADGTTLYSTRDLASIEDRLKRYHPNKIIYVVDVAQKLHFQQLFETAKKLDLDAAELVHVSFGRMQFPEGKMSTRKGDVVLLDEVIREAIARTEKIVEEKSRELSPEEKAKVAEGMAIGAIKYNIFSQNRESNITFEWDRMLSLEGNSAPYLQYAYARAQSILRKAEEAQVSNTPVYDENADPDNQTSLFTMENQQKTEQEKVINPFEHPTEQQLLKLLARFPEKVALATKEYKPSTITTYLFEVSRAFSSFYNEVHVLSASRPELKETRLKLVKGTAQILKNGLNLLKIQTFERM